MGDNFIEKIVCGRQISSRDNLASLLTATQNQWARTKDELSTCTFDKQALVSQLTASGDQCKQQVASLQTQLDAKTITLSQLQTAYDALAASQPNDVFHLLPPAVQNSMNSYYTKYPDARITYAGRTLPNQPTKGYGMNVLNWAQYGINSPEILSLVSEANSNVKKIMNELQVGAHRACDIAVSRFKMRVSKFYIYSFDSATTGDNEYWKFGEETYFSAMQNIGSDCDDWAVLNHVGARASGVPAPLLRITAGTTRGNEGHATNMYYASDTKWHHNNSTTPRSLNWDVLTAPLINDASDMIGIPSANVWFSFNDAQSWSQQGTPDGTTAQQLPNYNILTKIPKLLKNIKIHGGV
ncbi:Uncharacterised protein [Candidatus Anstonella stagnisolia]|nr:Uncharacterised protein [Candidatus Anstonella stagnisolia]